MCLREPSKIKMAEQDIEVIKYLRGDGGGLFSPFQSHPYVLGELQVMTPEDWETTRKDVMPGYAYHRVDHGFHSLKEVLKPDPYPPARYWQESTRQQGEVNTMRMYHAVPFRAVIPAGAEYVEGVDDWGMPCYASNQLIVKEEIKS